MKCPNCKADNNIVIDSRNNKTGGQKRIRKCISCGTRFKTKEELYVRTNVTEKPLPAWYVRQMGKEIVINASRNTV